MTSYSGAMRGSGPCDTVDVIRLGDKGVSIGGVKMVE